MIRLKQILIEDNSPFSTIDDLKIKWWDNVASANIKKLYNCKFVFIEDLHFKDISKIKIFNRLVRNLWKKSLFISNLTKRLNIEGIKLYSVNPAYSSFIGNLQHDYTDPVNASIEIARRGYEYRVKKNKKGFYPSLVVKHQWKEMFTTYTDWKKFFFDVEKNLKLKYRVSLDECSHKFKVFQQNSRLNFVFYEPSKVPGQGNTSSIIIGK